ncbi:MAG: DNA repair protein RadC [Anaerovoracaceae bacterium]
MVESKDLMIRDLPARERPRERLLRQGARALSDSELLAILLRTGSNRESALELAKSLIIEIEGIENLKLITLEELTAMHGIGSAKAMQIIAAIELGRRLREIAVECKSIVSSPADAAHYIADELRDLQQEHFVVLLLDTKNSIISKELITVGTLNSSIVHPREVFKPAIKKSSSAIILVHNHPSGDSTPSREDIDVTKRLIKVGDVIGIEVLDHIIIGGAGYTSLREQGRI